VVGVGPHGMGRGMGTGCFDIYTHRKQRSDPMKSKPNYIIIENERAAANLSLLCLVLELNHVGIFSTAPPSDAISFAF